MNYVSNINAVVQSIKLRLEALKNPDEMLREVAKGLLSEIKVRVHKNGQATDGNQIGTYSQGYMKIRMGDFSNSSKFVRGAKKGQLKQGKDADAGKHTKGIKAGESRPNYNRGSSTKVILSLKRQMENDLSVIAVPNGYGIGFKNSFNFQKSQWVEKTYKKPIWNLTAQEKELVITIATNYIENLSEGEQKATG